MTPSELTSALNWRYAAKQFDTSRSIPADAWESLVHSLHSAPSSFGLQPWKFLIIEDKELRTKLREASWGQGQVTDADKLVVFTARTDMSKDFQKRWIDRLAEVQGRTPDDLAMYTKVLEGFTEPMTDEQAHTWNIRQVYIALGQFMTAAAAIRVDTCPLEGIDPAAYDQILGLDGSGYATCVACVAGYRSEDDKYATTPKARFALDEVVETR